MRIVVIGGTGRIGSKLVSELDRLGRVAVAAAPKTGVDTITGEGLAEALLGAQVVVDVSQSPSIEGDAALHFFKVSGERLLAAARAAGVRHHMALSVVGTDRLQDIPCFRAKKLQWTTALERPGQDCRCAYGTRLTTRS